MADRIFFEFSSGNVDEHQAEVAAYDNTAAFLRAKGAIYGLPPSTAPADLTDEQQELLLSVWDGEREFSAKGAPRLQIPTPLVLGRVVVQLYDRKDAPKAYDNIVALCTGSKGMSKAVKTAALHYKDVPMHRIVSGFVAQGGDVTRKDGSGGDSIYNGKFNDEKGGLRKGWKRGTLAMANSGKNSNTSQFFFCLSDDAVKYAKLEGKHVVLGETVEGLDVLTALDALGSASGTPTTKVWISDCGVAKK
ncbi:hypothetical protein GGF31_001258 [Allomyces arbusculus]|nr:hypothetical protein GGF31_001258 [Allomyces arbusculus]